MSWYQDKRKRCFVYFIRRADGEGPVKIGCSEYPETRLANLMCWSPYPLAILTTTPGDERLEKRFHANFAAQHSHREWFHWSPELGQAIEAVQAGRFDFDALPVGRRISHPGNTKIPHITRRRIGFQSAVARVLHSAGFLPPADVREAADNFDRLTDAEIPAAEALIREFVRAPHERGVPLKAPWAPATRKAYFAKLADAA